MYHVLEVRTKSYFTIYRCGDIEDYFYGYMVPDTSYLDLFSPEILCARTHHAFTLRNRIQACCPNSRSRKNCFAIFNEYKKLGADPWCLRILAILTMASGQTISCNLITRR